MLILRLPQVARFPFNHRGNQASVTSSPNRWKKKGCTNLRQKSLAKTAQYHAPSDGTNYKVRQKKTNPMKHILIVTFLVCAMTSARADQLGHEEVVRTLISAAQKDQLRRFLTTTDLTRIAAHPKHGHSPEALLDLLKKIPSGDLKFEVREDAATKSTLVRLVSPIRLDFTLERRGPYADEDEDRFVVVSVTP